MVACLKCYWSPEQIAGRLALEGALCISYESIYRYIWRDWHNNGTLHLYLRRAQKQRKKHYGSSDSRGRVRGKRWIDERPAAANNRTEVGHLEIDTVIGPRGDNTCMLTMVDRKSGYVMIGKLANRSQHETASRTRKLLSRHPGKLKTITADNGTEFHNYAQVEAKTGVAYYFARPYKSNDRALNENTNGLIRQYEPKKQSMAGLTQPRCNAIADALNHRPRKRLGYRTPAEVFEAE